MAQYWLQQRIVLNSFNHFFSNKQTSTATDTPNSRRAKYTSTECRLLHCYLLLYMSADANGTAAERTTPVDRPSLMRAIVLRPCDLYAGNILIIL